MDKMIKTEKIILVVTIFVLVGTAVFFSLNDKDGYNVKNHIRWKQPVDVTAHVPRYGQKGININTANADELQTLPGIGPELARCIVEDRQLNGPFTIPENIIRVKGIGQETLEEILNYITVG